MIIETRRLTLRPFTIEDLEAKHAYASDVESNKYMLFLPKLNIEETKASLERTLNFWSANPVMNYEFAICLGDEVIGEIGLYHIDNDTAEFGWVLHKDHHNKGYVTEAALTMINFAKELNYTKLIAHVDKMNVASRKVMEKIGMLLSPKTGYRRNKIFTYDTPECLYVLFLRKIKVGYICVHNSCRSQIAEALSNLFVNDIIEPYSAGTILKPEINKDAVRLIKKRFDYDMKLTQKSKLIDDLPPLDIVITMGCNVLCPTLPSKHREDWGLEDPTGSSDQVFDHIIDTILFNVIDLKQRLLRLEI